MKLQLDNGQLTASFNGAWIGRNGPGSGHGDGLRVQIYFPSVYYKRRLDQRDHREFYVGLKTCLRAVSEQGYWGIGGELLGFGGAIDWQKQSLKEG